MRQSRKAGLFDRGVKWVKYRYVYQLVKDLTGYTLSDWEIIETGTTQSGTSSFFGYDSYGIIMMSENNAPYCEAHYDFYLGRRDAISQLSPGTVYDKDYSPRLDRSVLAKTTVCSDGSYTISHQVLTSNYTNERYEYRVYTRIGFLRAAEGEYPDAKNGFTYVKTTDDGFTIMKDSNDKYYAYAKVE